MDEAMAEELELSQRFAQLQTCAMYFFAAHPDIKPTQQGPVERGAVSVIPAVYWQLTGTDPTTTYVDLDDLYLYVGDALGLSVKNHLEPLVAGWNYDFAAVALPCAVDLPGLFKIGLELWQIVNEQRESVTPAA